MDFFHRKKKNSLPEGTKEQGGLDTFKFKTGWNNVDKKFYISLTSRKTFHTARLNVDAEDYKRILEHFVAVWESETSKPETEYRNLD